MIALQMYLRKRVIFTFKEYKPKYLLQKNSILAYNVVHNLAYMLDKKAAKHLQFQKTVEH